MNAYAQHPIKTIFNRLFHLAGVIVNSFEVFSLVVCVGALTILLIANFIARELFTSIYFAEEISEFLVIFTTFAGVSYGVRRARHIRMGAFLDMMPPFVQKILIIIISAVSAFVMFFMAHVSYNYLLHALHKAHETPALKLPYWIFYVIVPMGFFMAGIQYLRTIIKNIVEKETWMSPEQQNEYEKEN
jgi:TRAP-type C4-dicarboxylate transport system permease small subunit